jgi:hypothetical protein
MGPSLRDAFATPSNWDYFLYVILFIQLILLLLLFSGSLRDSIFIAITVMCAVADKAYLFGYIEGGRDTYEGAVAYHSFTSFWTYAIRVAMFALPLIITTQTKVKRAQGLSILLAIVSGVYMFGRWYFQQRDAPSPSSVGFVQQMFFSVQVGIVFLAHIRMQNNHFKF